MTRYGEENMLIYLTDKSDEPNYDISFEEFVRDYLKIDLPLYQTKAINDYLEKETRNEQKVKEFLHCPECWYTNEPRDVRIITMPDIGCLRGYKLAELQCFYCGYHRRIMLEG